MSLFDVIDEISARQATKTETGDTRIYGVMVGIVAKNYDKDMGGRLCVTIPVRDKGANELQWARLAMPSSGEKWGHYFLPEVGDQVLLAFEGGNIERPYVIGCVPKDSNRFLNDAVDADNQYKRIVTKHGSTIEFEDNKNSEDGSKDKILIRTANKMHTITLDNENEMICIADQKKKNYLELTTKEGSGSLTIAVESQLTIKVGDNIRVSLNGENGAVRIKAESVSIETSQNVMVKSDASIRLEGSQIIEKSSSGHSMDSGGMVKIAGSAIKIG